MRGLRPARIDVKALLLMIALFAAPPARAGGIDLPRYMGTWHEIAYIPNFAQKGCTDTAVHYRLRGSGGFDLVNACWKGDAYKPFRGKATPAGTGERFQIKILWFFKADYWIVDVDSDYRWALVGTPKRDQLWVISRDPVLDPALYEEILSRARAKGFDTGKLVRTVVTGRPSRGFDS